MQSDGESERRGCECLTQHVHHKRSWNKRIGHCIKRREGGRTRSGMGACTSRRRPRQIDRNHTSFRLGRHAS